MRHFLHELGRAARLTPLEVRTRWHAARLERHERLAVEHRDAFDTCMNGVRALVDTRA